MFVRHLWTFCAV